MTDTLRVAIVDDEPLARAMVRQCVAAHPGVEVVAECANGFEAVKAVTEPSPDPVPRRADAEVERLRGPGADWPRRGGDLHDGVRPVRAACLRSARRRLPAEAVQRGAVCRSAVARARAAGLERRAS